MGMKRMLEAAVALLALAWPLIDRVGSGRAKRLNSGNCKRTVAVVARKQNNRKRKTDGGAGVVGRYYDDDDAL
jgi:hypothetical protein